ncbi:MAG: VOC family protein, partial [Gemmatimonadota bacterium]|nr:VOC family protein [Gemmatimonadota bacterium]
MTTAFHIDGIAQIHISVSDLPRAVAFYRDILDLALLFEVPAQSMAFFDCGGVRLYLGRPENPEHRSQSFIYYRVPSMTAAFDTLSARGVEFSGAPHAVHTTDTYTLWLAAFRDPDGNYLHLM